MGRRHGLVIDLERCIGCHTCSMACKLENGLEKGSWIRVETIGGPHRDTPVGKHPQLSMHFLPVLCMHCEQPPCLQACPLEAIYKRDDGIVLIDEEKCDGCQACLPACPYDALLYDVGRNIVQKCTFCAHRLEEDLKPFCLICCETEAMFFGDINDRDSDVSKLIVQRGAAAIKSEKRMNPAVYYCPTKQGRIE